MEGGCAWTMATCFPLKTCNNNLCVRQALCAGKRGIIVILLCVCVCVQFNYDKKHCLFILWHGLQEQFRLSTLVKGSPGEVSLQITDLCSKASGP